MRLNPSNELVQATYAFVSQGLEQVRHELVDREKRRRAGEEARRLAAEAAEIARFINEDFDSFRDKIAKVRAKAPGSVDLAPAQGGEQGPGPDLESGTEVPAEVTSTTGGVGAHGDQGGNGGEPRLLMPQVEPASPAERLRVTSPTRKSRGGFNVEFQAMGADERRASYSPDERTIYINLEHPQLVAARGTASIEDPMFRRLAYEVAFTEYAIALSSELAQRGEYLDPSDPIYEIRETVNRLARRGASLYSA
jgi:hypothetical protein